MIVSTKVRDNLNLLNNIYIYNRFICHDTKSKHLPSSLMFIYISTMNVLIVARSLSYLFVKI